MEKTARIAPNNIAKVYSNFLETQSCIKKEYKECHNKNISVKGVFFIINNNC